MEEEEEDEEKDKEKEEEDSGYICVRVYVVHACMYVFKKVGGEGERTKIRESESEIDGKSGRERSSERNCIRTRARAR